MGNRNDIFGKRLKMLRNKRGETQESIANGIGISRARYSHYENSHVEPDIDLIKKFADYFNVDADYLLGRNDTLRESDYNDDCDSLSEIKKIVEGLGIKDLFFDSIDDWKDLTHEDVKEVKNHFDYIVYRAKKKKKDS